MNPAALAVRNWQVMLIAFVAATLLGISAFLNIPRSVDPHFPTAFVIVTVVAPGLDAANVEETIAKPIEIALQGLDRVREIRSTSTDGVAVVSIDFLHGTDGEQSLDRTVRVVQAIRDRLPQGVARITYRRPRTTDAAVLQLAVLSEDANWRRMVLTAQDLRDRLSVVPGVREVAIDGAAQPEVRVAIDSGRLAELGVPASAVTDALRAGGVDLAVGSVSSGDRRFNVDAGGAYRSLDAVRNVPVRLANGSTLRVGDVAAVDWAEAERLQIARLNGKRALWVTVRQKDNEDASSLRNVLVSKIEHFRGGMPPDIKLAITFDQSNDITERLKLLGRDFLIALTLVLITLLPLGLRSSLIVMISIPLSLAIGVLVLALFGFTLNQISIAGFILSLGLVVDDSIVVTENIERHIRGGAAPISAAISGASEIGLAVLGSTLVLILAFLPLAMLPEGSGDFVRGMPLAVISTVASSLVVSMTVIPFLASRLLKDSGEHGNRFLQLVTAGIERSYAPTLHRALNAPWRWFAGAMALCVLSLGFIPLLGFSLFPAAETPYFLVRIELPEGSSIAATDRVVQSISRDIAREPLVVDRMENAGRGNPQLYYNLAAREERPRYGEIFVTMKEWDPDEGSALLQRLRDRFQHHPDARVTVVNTENGPPVDAPVAVRISGPDLAVLKQLSAQVAQIMQQTPGLRDVDNPVAYDRVDLDLHVDEARARQLGVPAGAARRAVRLAIGGETASSFRDDEGNSWPVTVRLPMAGSQPISALERVYVPRADGTAIPLGQIARPELKTSPPQVMRRELQRTVTISAYNQPGRLASKLNNDVQERLRGLKLPPGYALSAGGEAEVAKRSFAGLGQILLLVVMGIFAVLLLEFGNFRDTIVVAGVIPLGMLGGLTALFLTGNSLSFLALIGFVALVGIEIKNSILLVDFASQLRRGGMELRDAIERAGSVRFLPVLLTSLTAVGGLLPLALSGSLLYAPVAWVLIGGLAVSTIMGRIVTPVLYLIVSQKD